MIDIFQSETEASSAIQTEAAAFCAGVNLALAKGLRRVIVEGDCLEVIKAINDSKYVRWEILREVELIRKLSSSFDNIEFRHCYREANKAADYIAKSRNTCTISNLPTCRDLCNIINLDDHGGISPR